MNIIKNVALTTISSIILLACKNEEEPLVNYHPNGEIESMIEVRENIQHGITRTFYSNGYIKYFGTFINGKKVGSHFEYYESDSGVVHYKVSYSGNQQGDVVYKKIFSRDGAKTYSAVIVDKEILIEIEKDTISVGEMTYASISFVKPKYPFISASVRNVDATNISKGIALSTKIMGENNIVRIPLKGKIVGSNIVSGYISDFDIVPIDNSIGITTAEETYFEIQFFVVNNRNS